MSAPPIRIDPNLAQRTAAAPDRSVWVTASAGSGKTKVLTDRVLRLLLQGTAPERILCLTFTKAAAAEMDVRLRRRLGEWATASEPALNDALTDLLGAPPDETAVLRARRLFAAVLDARGGPTIETVHAFCQSMLRRFPIEAGVAPHFDVSDDRTAQDEVRAARDTVLRRAGAEPEGALADLLQRVTGRVGELAFDDLMRALIAERGRLLRLAETAGGVDGMAEEIRAALGLPRDATLAEMMAEGCSDDALDGEGLRSVCAALERGGEADAKRAAAVRAWLEAPDGRVAGFDAYRSIFFTSTGEIRKTLATKPVLKILADADAILRAEAERVQALCGLCNAAAVADATVALATLAMAQLDVYDERKRRRGILDFDDLVLRSRHLLESGAAGWVQYKLDGGVDHVLIDEGQDTNPDQWAVVEALAGEFFAGAGAREGERTIFAVGDPKQSIFSFQRADPARFAAMQAMFRDRSQGAEKIWEDVGLDVSFRSVPAVLQAVDAVFADETVAAGVVPPGAPLRHHAHRAGQSGLVELWPLVGDLPGEPASPWEAPTRYVSSPAPESRLAELIAATIAGWIARGEMLEARGRPIRAGDVMVLVRRRTGFIDALVRELKRRDVPVAGVDRMRLAEQLAVADLMALARFLLMPEDDLTLAVVLKSPLGGIDEDQLFALAAERRGTLWRRLGEMAAAAPGSAFEAAHSVLEAMLAQADVLRPYELFADLLGPRRGRERLLARLGAEANDPIDVFLAQALAYERLHPPSLQGFVQWMEVGQDEVKRDMEQGERDQVRIITVHGAKGLQAPIVIMPDTARLPVARRPPFWVAREDGEDIVLWPPRKDMDDPVSRAVREAAAIRDSEEYRRLLYVALTRAEDRLYVCGWCPDPDKVAADSWYGLVAAGLSGIAETVDFDFSEIIEGGWSGRGLRLRGIQEVPFAAVAAAPPGETVEQPLPAWAAAVARIEPSARPLAPSHGEDEDTGPPAQSPLGTDDGLRFRRGLLIHRLLQTLPDLDPAARAAAAARYLARAGRDIPDAGREEIAAEALAVLDHADFAPVFAAGSRAEVAVAGTVGDVSFSGQIDRLAVTDSGVLIVDYKSNRPPPATAERVSPVYLRQMAAYRALLRRIYPGMPVRCALLWTETPRLMPLPDTLLDRYEPA